MCSDEKSFLILPRSPLPIKLEKGLASAAPGYRLPPAGGIHPVLAASQAGPLSPHSDDSHLLWSSIVLNSQNLKKFLVKTVGPVHCFGLVGFVFQILCN